MNIILNVYLEHEIVTIVERNVNVVIIMLNIHNEYYFNIYLLLHIQVGDRQLEHQVFFH